MKVKLTLAGIFVAIHTYFLITAFFYLYGEQTVLEVERTGLFNTIFLRIVLFSSVVVIPAHFYLNYRAYKVHKMEKAFVLPYLTVPYMIGIIVHTMIQ